MGPDARMIASPWTDPEPAARGPFRPADAPTLTGPGVASVAVAFPEVSRRDPTPPPAVPRQALAPGMEGAVPKRQLEYVAGRLAAREALRRLGRPGTDWLGRGEDRAPVWPEGLVGSITHTRGFAWAVAAPRPGRRGLGTDLEALIAPRSMEAIRKLVLRDEERRDFRASPLGERAMLTLIFGAKECLFKCLYPTVLRFFGFEAARLLEVDQVAGRFRIRLLEDLHPDLPAGREWPGRFQLLEHPGGDAAGDAAGDAGPLLAAAIEWGPEPSA